MEEYHECQGQMSEMWGESLDWFHLVRNKFLFLVGVEGVVLGKGPVLEPRKGAVQVGEEAPQEC